MNQREKVMVNPNLYTHESAVVVERKIVEVGHSGEKMEIRIQPNVKKSIK